MVERGVVEERVAQLWRDWWGDEGRPVMVELGGQRGEGSEGFDGGEALDRLGVGRDRGGGGGGVLGSRGEDCEGGGSGGVLGGSEGDVVQ